MEIAVFCLYTISFNGTKNDLYLENGSFAKKIDLIFVLSGLSFFGSGSKNPKNRPSIFGRNPYILLSILMIIAYSCWIFGSNTRPSFSQKIFLTVGWFDMTWLSWEQRNWLLLSISKALAMWFQLARCWLLLRSMNFNG